MPLGGALAGTQWSGRVASLVNTAAANVTGAGLTEGGNLLTYTVERTGLYRIHSALVVVTAGTASQTAKVQVTHNNGAAQAAADLTIPSATVTALPADGAVGTKLYQQGLVYAVAGTNIVVNVFGAGTMTLPAVLAMQVDIAAV